MNKALNEFLNAHAFTYDSAKGFYGNLNGFQLSGNLNAMTGSFVTVNVFLNAEAISSVNSWLTSNKRAYGIMNPEVTENRISVMINPPFGVVKKFIAYMEAITAFLAGVATPNACPFCGQTFEETDDMRLVGAYGRMFRAHEHCFDEYAEKVKQGEIVAATAPNNTLMGVVGAIIGALLGCIVWGVLYFVGYINVVAAVLTAYGAAFMWGKFGGKNNKTKIVAIWFVTIIMLFITMFSVYLIDVAMALNSNGMAGESALEWLFVLIRESGEVRTEIMIDTIISLIFIIVGNVLTTMNVLKTQKLESTTLIKY